MKRATGNAGWEWATQGQGVGATLNLKWGAAQTFNQLVLYDRPNLQDQILGGLLTFSDGTRIEFGPLNNDGSATVINLANTVKAKSILLTVTKVSSTTTNVGLSEIEVRLADPSTFTSVYTQTRVPPRTTTTVAARTTATTAAQTTTPPAATSTSSVQTLWYADTPTTTKPAQTSVVRKPWSAATSLLGRVILANPKSKRAAEPTAFNPMAPAPRHVRDFKLA